MKKLDLGQAANTLASVGVIVGILLLVYELNQNRDMMRAQTRNDVAGMLVNLMVVEASVPEVTNMVTKQEAGQQLTASEKRSFDMLLGAYWRYRENVHYQYRNGLYDEEEYLALRAAWVQGVNSNEMVRDNYCERRSQSPPAFVAEMDSQLDRPCE